MLRYPITIALVLLGIVSPPLLRADDWGTLTARVIDKDDHKPVTDVAFYLLPKRGEQPKIHPSYDSAAESKVEAEISTDRVTGTLRIEPRVVLLRSTQPFVLRNGTNSAASVVVAGVNNPTRDVRLRARDSYDMTLAVERSPVGVTVHDNYRGGVIVQDHPYFAVTSEDGQVTIENLPVGSWEFRVWHPDAGWIKNVTINGTQREWRAGKLELTIVAGTNDLGTVELDPTSFAE